MAIREREPFMGDSHTNFFENPRFNFLRREKKTVKLSSGEEISVIKDINSYTSDLLEKEIENQGQKPPVQERRPLVGSLKRALTGIVNGTIKS